MKKIFFTCAALFTVALTTPSFISCGSDDKEEEVVIDAVELNNTLAEAKALLAGATAEDYPQEAIASLTQLVQAVEAAQQSGLASQSAADALVKQLQDAMETFKKAAYGFIDPANIVLALDVEETIGGTAKPVAGTSLIFPSTAAPTEVAGHNATSKAWHFGAGSHVEVEGLNVQSVAGAQLTVACWVNPDEIYENNYIASMNQWNTWKFQLQSANKPFFTCHTNEDGWCDADTDGYEAPVKTWTHQVAVMDLTKGTLTFYADGVEVRAWNIDEKGGLHGTGLMLPEGNSWKFCLGAQVPNDITAELEGKTDSNFGYFKGSIDGFKVFNTALTAGQVKKLYKDEK